MQQQEPAQNESFFRSLVRNSLKEAKPLMLVAAVIGALWGLSYLIAAFLFGNADLTGVVVGFIILAFMFTTTLLFIIIPGYSDLRKYGYNCFDNPRAYSSITAAIGVGMLVSGFALMIGGVTATVMLGPKIYAYLACGAIVTLIILQSGYDKTRKQQLEEYQTRKKSTGS